MNEHRSAAVSIRDLSFEIDAQLLLDCINLNVKKGEMVGLIGPNGAGKSTLLRSISGILGSKQGAISLEARDLADMSAKEVAAGLALVPQIAPYTHGFTSMELVIMGRYPHLGRFQIEGKSDEQIARCAMSMTETDQFAERTLDTLSGGERQRVLVARALAQQPRVLLLDEPTSNLDVLHQLMVLDLVRQLVDGGLTAVAAFHDLSMAARYCDKLVVLSNGRVVATGPPEQVLTPCLIEKVFEVRAAVYRDPATGGIAVSLIGPAKNGKESVSGSYTVNHPQQSNGVK